MESVSRVELTVNGKAIDDFKTCSEKEIELGKAVNLMNKTSRIKKLPRYGVSVEYVVPAGRREFNFKKVVDGTLVINQLDGVKIVFNGVSVLKIGELKYDEDNEATKTIDFMATGRVEI